MATPLRPEHLRAIMPNIPQQDEVTEFSACCSVMRRFDINTKKRAAAWLGNVAKESGELYYTEEIASGAAYEGRADLGNTVPGDGVRFKGRGYIQITGRHNYTRVAKELKIPCLARPDLLEQMPHRWTTAGYYWKFMSPRGDLNLIADGGDFETTVLGVRGGPDPQRRKYYDRAMQVLPDDLTIPGADSAPQQMVEKKAIILKAGLGKDGNPNGVYEKAHPTNYNWRENLELLTDRLVNRPEFYGEIWINTYFQHPPGGAQDTWRHRDGTSFDVWGFGGRGDPIGTELGDRVFDLLFNDPDPPDIWWIIWNGRMWTRAQGFLDAPPGPPGSDPDHVNHIHVTYMD